MTNKNALKELEIVERMYQSNPAGQTNTVVLADIQRRLDLVQQAPIFQVNLTERVVGLRGGLEEAYSADKWKARELDAVHNLILQDLSVLRGILQSAIQREP